jgi:hypothetical protein
MGASFMFGFQTYKEPSEGKTPTERNAKLCCIEANSENGWEIPQPWINRQAGIVQSV